MEVIQTVRQAKEFAEKLASRLKPGDVVGFIGELGSGKTTIIQHIARKLGVNKNITSPTYLYIKIYLLPNNVELVHCDAYQINSEADYNSMDLSHYINNRIIVLIEWADKIINYLPPGTNIYSIRVEGYKRIIES